MNDESAVRELTGLYKDLRELDHKLSSLVSGGRVTMVKFPIWTPCSSGPVEHFPDNYTSEQIASLVIGDLCERRRGLVKKIGELGFIAPAGPSLTKRNPMLTSD